jgi:hypothetical protein
VTIPPPENADQSAEPTSTAAGTSVDEGTPARLGVREGPVWESSPPERSRPSVPLGLHDRVAATSGVIRSSLRDSAPLPEREPTALDTLLFIQQRLADWSEEALRKAREAPGAEPYWGPVPQPGSMQDLREGPMTPLLPLAALVAEQLVDLGKAAWDRLVSRPGDDTHEHLDMDLTYEMVLAYAGLDDHRPLNLFAWYARLPAEFEGGVGTLQESATQLASRDMIELVRSEESLEYRRLVPLADVVDYYTSYLSRVPERDAVRRQELIRIIAALVREHR